MFNVYIFFILMSYLFRILVNIMKLPIGATKHLKTNLSKMRNHLFEKQLSIMFRTVGLILMYYFFSIGITFYQKWFIKVLSIHLKIYLFK